VYYKLDNKQSGCFYPLVTQNVPKRQAYNKPVRLDLHIEGKALGCIQNFPD